MLAANQESADWINSQLPDPLPPTKRPSPGADKDKVRVYADPELLHQLAAVGNNLNQLTRAINRGELVQTRWLQKKPMVAFTGQIRGVSV